MPLMIRIVPSKYITASFQIVNCKMHIAITLRNMQFTICNLQFYAWV
jgi:hypothetical protein